MRARSFGSNADAYERTRPLYPEEAVRWVVGDDARRILDLGAGTGKLTRSLVALGHDVIAVEPSSEMIGQLRLALPGVEALEGAAERIPIPPGRVDVVTAGQAFHWFDAELALPEIARVLRPGGTIGLLWNLWDEESPLVARMYDLLPPFGGAGEPSRPRRSSAASSSDRSRRRASIGLALSCGRSSWRESARNRRSPPCPAPTGPTDSQRSAGSGTRSRPAASSSCRIERTPIAPTVFKDVSGL